MPFLYAFSMLYTLNARASIKRDTPQASYELRSNSKAAPSVSLLLYISTVTNGAGIWSLLSYHAIVFSMLTIVFSEEHSALHDLRYLSHSNAPWTPFTR